MRSALKSCWDDPDRFNQLILRRPAYWSRQADICRAIAKGGTVAVPTGNGVGKSYLAAGLILWYLFTRPKALVPVTSASQSLLGTVLWKEINRALLSMSSVWPIRYKSTLSPKASPQLVELAPGHWAIGLSTDEVERYSGQHAEHLLQVIDEASGVADAVWEAFASQGPERRIVFGNPLQPGTMFHKICQREDVQVIKISSLESPDAELERSPRGLADAKFLREAREIWGEGSPLWSSHVLGEFPTQSAYALIEQAWINLCATTPRSNGVVGGQPVLAVDLAMGVGADRSVILVRDSLGILHLDASANWQMTEVAGRVAQLARQWRVQANRIVYDAGGIGRDFNEYLRPHEIRGAIGYHGAEAGSVIRGIRFGNLRTACAWRLRLRLNPEVRQRPTAATRAEDREYLDRAREYQRTSVPWVRPAEPVLQAQPPFAIPTGALGGLWPQLYEELLGLQWLPGDPVRLEPKEKLMGRLGRSPDLADALLMSFAVGGDE